MAEGSRNSKNRRYKVFGGPNLEGTRHSFCFILLLKASHRIMIDSRAGEVRVHLLQDEGAKYWTAFFKKNLF